MDRKINDLIKKTQEEIAKVKSSKELNNSYLKVFGKNGIYNKLLKELPKLAPEEKKIAGRQANEGKLTLQQIFEGKKEELAQIYLSETLDVTAPGVKPSQGHLHLVTKAIEEIEEIFLRIGFSRQKYREVEWEWYAFESLNMPKNHPARDDFETFFVEGATNNKYGGMVLSPHTSSGQQREMERVKSTPPIRMINIAKCYRPNWDNTHTPMFHQFEGLAIDHGINITHLKGIFDYFAREFFGSERKTRLRPFHFQFTEPSFEVDINCGLCLGKGILVSGEKCRFCKSGWLELGGAGMVHPHVLNSGGIDPVKYSGFAFGWGIERTYLMKSGIKIDDLRILYQNDIRFLEQF